MKNKVLIALFLSLFCLPFMVQAQWEKCAEQKDILVGKDYYSDGGVNNIAHYKNTTLTATYIDDIFTMYYSNDRGRHWNKLKMPINKTIKGNYPSGSYQNSLIAINQLGIFYSTRKYLTNLSGSDRQIVSHTKDLGVTWTIDTLPGGLISTDSNMYLITDKLFPYTSINLYLPKLQQLYKYNASDGQWKVYYDFALTQEQDPNQFLNISKNRIAYSTTDSIVIRDEATKELLAKFAKKGTASTMGSLGKIGTDINCFAVDSMVVYYYTKANKFFIDVSKDLGRTWMSSLVDLPHIVLRDCNPSISIENNKIYVSGDQQILVSADFGRTWQPILNQLYKTDKLISRFVVADSLLLVRYAGKLFTRKTNETNWTYSNNTFSDFFDLIKINDALIWATGRANQHLTSSNYGKTWQVIRPDDTLLLNNNIFLGKDGIIYTDNRLKSDDMGNTWQVSPFPEFSTYQIVGDTIFIARQNSIMYSPKAPYQVWTTVVGRSFSGSIYDYIARFYYHNGVIYYATIRSDFGLKRSKLDGTELPNILLEENISKLIVDKNKIYFTYPSNILKVAFTNDNGLTWQKYILPNYDWDALFRTDNFLLASTVVPKQCGKLTTTTGGVYMSADDGKSWFLFSEGIQPECTSFKAHFYRIDSFIYVKSDYGLWRTNIANLKLKPISGTVFVDKNRNGIKDVDEQGVYNARVLLSKTGAFTTTDSLGNYSFVVDLKETDTLRASWDNQFATYNPSYLLVNQSDTVKNLGIYLPENLKDLSVTVTAFSPPRGGFNNTYLLTYTNKGTGTRNGKVSYQYASEQTFIEARPVATSPINKTLSWDFQNLKSGESRNINLTFKTNINVQRGSRITNIATIEPIVDDTLKSNNIDTLIQIVVGSFDPNDKQVSFKNNNATPPSVIDPNLELIYTIRFQNTGNYQADLVRVVDTLSDKLDITTLRVLASSHNYTLTVKNKNVLLFDFNPIYLPDSTTSEKESHGFIKFAIKPKRFLSATEIIKNTAYIYFDYNEAVVTNTVETPNQKVNSVFTPSVSETIWVYPNPTNGALAFKLDKFQGRGISINIYTIDGRLVLSQNTVGDAVNTINGDGLPEGLYILQVKSDNELALGRFVVKK